MVATEEYIKKSNAFNEQMMSLIKARADEEEAFIAGRNASLTNALGLTEATAEATSSAATEAVRTSTSSIALDAGLQVECPYSSIFFFRKIR
jgi:hypothetical protein